jgi:ribonuclease P protein component
MKISKIKKSEDIKNIFKNGTKLFSNSFVLFYLYQPLAITNGIKAVTIAPKKHFKLATDRNRYKRVLLEALRVNSFLLNGKYNNTFVLLAKPEIYQSSFQQVQEQLKSLLTKIN